ncbi:MAG: carotenoid 1,2-hydratase [Thauera sp.]|nr:carotenoid 1,2-hydratase [Thauera sp.]
MRRSTPIFGAAPRRALVCVLCWLIPGLSFAADAGNGTAFAPVRPGHALSFPADLGAHPDFRTEWWYITGWTTDESGMERGFQVTFFRVRSGIGEGSASRFAPSQLVLAHAAVADPAIGRLRHAERAERAYSPLVGADRGATKAWVRDWILEWTGDRYRTRVAARDFTFELDFIPPRVPVLNGRGGYSQKSPEPHHASFYYSRPQLAVTGTLRVDGKSERVRGSAWLDHEWSSELMPERARGWDWLGINLQDGGSLMAFRMRDTAGAAIWTAFTLVDRNTEHRSQGPDAVRFTPLRNWRSPRSGAQYPVEWEIELNDQPGGEPRRLRVVPLMDDQELDSSRSTGAIYWEGAVRVTETPSDASAPAREIGRGYLEMTGYADRPRL